MHALTRRHMLAIGGAASLAAIASPFSLAHARQETVMNVEQAGRNFVRYRFGDITMIALRDGYVDMPPSRLRQGGGEPFEKLPEGVPLVEGKLRLSVNAYLIIENDLHFLIDTGAANSWEPTMGSLLDGLAEAGVARESIINVALTHTHTDHVNGLIAADGSEAFPKAERIFVGQEEAPMFETSNRLARLRERVVPIDNNYPISDRISAIKAAGHSLGHTAYEVESGDNRLLVWGDIVHVPSAQFSQPELTWELDGDQQDAMETRRRLLERVAQPNYHIAGAHLDFPGVGQVRKNGTRYAFEALDEV
jgi:glyoxylase-like metal-dependent hydrolase (beta-lactamase superfamily II)